jgi:hypothetical protein
LGKRHRDGEQSRGSGNEHFLAPSECHLNHTLLRWEVPHEGEGKSNAMMTGEIEMQEGLRGRALTAFDLKD